MQKESLVEGTIESLAFGGQGILKSEGLVIFVPFTAPGDVVQCRLTEVKKNFAEGKVVQLLKPGPGRAAPPCPYYEVCGGCQLQHLDYDKQLTYKQKAVADSLQRIGKVDLRTLPPITPATAIWAYRRHITLTLRPLGKGYEAGYMAVDGSTLVPIKECPIFLPKADPLFSELDVLLKKLESHTANPGRVTMLKSEDQTFLLYFRFYRLPRNYAEIFEEVRLRWPQCAGIAASGGKKTLLSGAATTQLKVEGLSITVSPAAFIQNHAEQSLNIYREVVQLTSAGTRVLDLYCGIGISSLLLAGKAAKVLGIEGSGEAVALAKKNAVDNGIRNAEFLASDVKQGLRGWLQDYEPELVLVNPPRGGLDKEVVKIFEQKPPKRLLYISCMPPTLARDVGILCNAGYRLESCRLYDMFPQTSHVETLVELVRQ